MGAGGGGTAPPSAGTRSSGMMQPARPSFRAGPQAMDSGQFNAFLAQVREQSFESERNEVIGLAAQRNYFSCAQAKTLLSGIDFAGEQISALRLVAPRLVDKKNSYMILSVFDFDSDKKKARKVLSR